ncbi:MAG: aminoglycoside phosphotransferase family protein [Lachnospiraceae bacterium]|nr:aminoglycoside phosphotransferase family protein [Lachnospiraceae bacterium]
MKTIEKLFHNIGLSEITGPITPVSGGFMHRMFRVDTSDGSYAVKHLNPEVMKRPGVFENYKRAESLETMLENAGIPIVPALVINEKKMQECDGEYFYVFDWHEGKITDWDHITPKQCRIAGSIQGRIHAIAPKQVEAETKEPSQIDWNNYINEAVAQNSEIEPILKDNLELLTHAQDEMNRANVSLPGIECITDEDMDPKNIMWENGEPRVIDLECLDYGNPVSHVLQLSLQWSGITTCTLDLDKTKAFFEGYLEAYDNGFRDYASVFGVAYTWIEWLEYNITRALGNCQDEAEQNMGISEVKNTIARIRYIADMEEKIIQKMNEWFSA